MSYNLLIPETEEKISHFVCSESRLKSAADSLAEELVKDIVDTERCIYIFSGLLRLATAKWDSVDPQTGRPLLSNEVKFSLLNSGVVCRNREGKSAQAKDWLEQLKETGSTTQIFKSLNVFTRVAELFADSYQFRQAYEMVNENRKKLEKTKEALDSIMGRTPEDAEKLKELGRAYSASGRYQAMMREDPMPFFEKALENFGKDDIGNRLITISHIISYACDMRNRELCNPSYYNSYFGTDRSAEARLKRILSGDPLDSYALYTFLKYVYVFEDSISDEMERMIVGLLSNETLLQKKSHPIQLIYKYIALILEKKNGKSTDEGKKAADLSLHRISQGSIDRNHPLNIFTLINYQTMAIYSSSAYGEGPEEKEAITRQLREHAEASGWSELVTALDQGTDVAEILRLDYC